MVIIKRCIVFVLLTVLIIAVASGAAQEQNSAPAHETGGEGPIPFVVTPPQNLDIARVVVTVDKSLAISCQFQLKHVADQAFNSWEYRYALYDKDGIEVRNALAIKKVMRAVLLPKGERSIVDPTDAVFVASNLTKGETYYLTVSVRNVTGLAVFTAP